MCTAIRLKNADVYFGRNLDLDKAFGQKVVFVPRDYAFRFRDGTSSQRHPALLGMATVVDGYPLFADAMNENGLAIAGLNFPGNAHYFQRQDGKKNVSPFELVPYVLSAFSSVDDFLDKAGTLSLWDQPFSDHLPLAPLHWIVADRKKAIVLESMADGLHVYENPFDVLTNNPPFPFHRDNLTRYRNLSSRQGENGFASDLSLEPFAAGFGTSFLPGGLDSVSRFVRACYAVKNVAFKEKEEKTTVMTFFRVLSSVFFLPGLVINSDGSLEKTLYSSCMNLDKGIYYYRTEDFDTIQSVKMDNFKKDGNEISAMPLDGEEIIVDRSCVA